MTSINDVMNYIFEKSLLNLDKKVLANIYDRLIWIFDDNGAALNEVRREWLTGSDPGRVEIALLMQETFPFNDRVTVEQTLFKIQEKFPQYHQLCDAMLRNWDNQYVLKPGISK